MTASDPREAAEAAMMSAVDELALLRALIFADTKKIPAARAAVRAAYRQAVAVERIDEHRRLCDSCIARRGDCRRLPELEADLRRVP